MHPIYKLCLLQICGLYTIWDSHIMKEIAYIQNAWDNYYLVTSVKYLHNNIMWSIITCFFLFFFFFGHDWLGKDAL